jgi:hypothetical protein
MLRLADALIHLRVPAATKARWVRESRAAGMRLTEWIVKRVESQPMKKITPIAIPQGLAFAALRLARDPATGDVSFDTAVIERIEAELLPPDAQVHLRVPMHIKAQWVRESRACGMKLTDWLLQRIEKGSA